ncbi:MAG: hypothetical protein AAF581_11145 [Planctomycetota bacterium]
MMDYQLPQRRIDKAFALLMRDREGTISAETPKQVTKRAGEILRILDEQAYPKKEDA